MNDALMNLTWLPYVGMILVILGVGMYAGATLISYRFFDENRVVRYALMFVGVVLAVVGFMLAAELLRV